MAETLVWEKCGTLEPHYVCDPENRPGGTPLIPPQKEVRDDGPPPTLVMNARDAEILMQHPDFIPSWATRIPAAIKRAK